MKWTTLGKAAVAGWAGGFIGNGLLGALYSSGPIRQLLYDPGLQSELFIQITPQRNVAMSVAGLVVLSGVHGALLLLLRRDAAPAAWVRHGLRLGFVIWATYWLFQEWFIYVTLLQEPLSLAGVELLLLLAGSLVEGTVIAWLLRSTPGLAAAGGIPIAPERQAADGTAEPRPL
ncbi:MAG: hypothetical protein U1F30_02795 [Steroidobacteraceae bacterium]